jgi:hypothetical protein
MKKPVWQTLILVALFLLLSVYIGGYLNPFVLEAYRLADVPVPPSVDRFASIGLLGCLVTGVIISIILVAKDMFLKSLFIRLINLVFFIVFISAVIFYPKFVDTIHLPLTEKFLMKNFKK